MCPTRSSNERRSLEREARHLSCEIRLGEKSYTGVILNLSAGGLWVRTNAESAPGSAVRVVVRRAGGEVWDLHTKVARAIEGEGAPASRRGLGLEIVEAPEGFHAFVAALHAEVG